jgi:hypothetical protein
MSILSGLLVFDYRRLRSSQVKPAPPATNKSAMEDGSGTAAAIETPVSAIE